MLVVIAFVLCAAPLAAQTAASTSSDQKIRSSQEQLDQIRREREALEHQAVDLRNSVHDISAEVGNLNDQVSTTARLVHALGAQLDEISSQVTTATTRVSQTETQLEERKASLDHRVVEIYKRGPLFTAQALLSARSFGELVARYKYLHLLALHDRALVTHVQLLRDSVVVERNQLVQLQTQLAENRKDKEREEDRLATLERARADALTGVKAEAKKTDDRISALKSTEASLSNAISALEAARKRTEAAAPAAAHSSSSIKTTDYGRLDWPVNGPLTYTYGKAQTASNATIHWNGVGITAPAGTPVHAIASGKIVSARPLGTYGLTVIIDHGAGDYSVYGSLGHADVVEGQTVAKGQSIGSVGVSDPDLPAHLHFEIRHGGPAVDPAQWLKDHGPPLR